jgi:glycosyltransferase involved in cell wall biosynthesis
VSPTVAVAVHDGFYSCGTGAGLCNRALLEVLVDLLSAEARMVLLPIGLSGHAVGYDPAWHRSTFDLISKVGAAIWPVDNGSGNQSRFGRLPNLMRASEHAAAILADGLPAADRVLVIAVDVPFFGLAEHLPARLAGQVVTIAQGTGGIHAPNDALRLAWERRGLHTSVAAGGVVAATSAAMRRHLVNGYGLPDSAVVDLPNGLTPADWQPLPDSLVPALPQAARGGFVLAMGRAEQHKGFDDLIDAVVLLRRHGIRVPHLLLAAVTDDPDPNGYQQHLARRLVNEQLDATLWTRFTHGIRSLLSHPALAAVVVPSRVEPFGRIPLEAYVAGAAPVVSTTAGGLAELVVDGRTGYTAPPADPPALAAALRRALGIDGATRELFRRTGRSLAATRYDYRHAVCGLFERTAPWLIKADPSGLGR